MKSKFVTLHLGAQVLWALDAWEEMFLVTRRIHHLFSASGKSSSLWLYFKVRPDQGTDSFLGSGWLAPGEWRYLHGLIAQVRCNSLELIFESIFD